VSKILALPEAASSSFSCVCITPHTTYVFMDVNPELPPGKYFLPLPEKGGQTTLPVPMKLAIGILLHLTRLSPS
jgi:hypothetical protein